MDFSHLFVWIAPVLGAVGLAVIGIVLGPRVGPGRNRMWTGLIILIVLQILSPLVNVVAFEAIYASTASVQAFALLNSLWNVFAGLGSLAAIAFLVSAATVGRGAVGPLDPTRPGAVPGSYGTEGYQGTGYPPASSSVTQRPEDQGSQQGNPYV